MTPLFILTDYKNCFGLKWKASPYRSGYDQRLLSEAFRRQEFAVEYVPVCEAAVHTGDFARRLVLYTSSEEIGSNYKSYIEDVIYGLDEAGACLLPPAKFLRAHNNKVFMEIVRDRLLGSEFSGLRSRCFGTLEEVAAALKKNEIAFPCVVKSASGAMSRGVALGRTAAEVLAVARRLSRTPHWRYEMRDFLRSKRIPGYRPESRHQDKLIIQPLIAGLDGDWKVLVYGDQYYVLKRHVRPGDFRASGSHYNYLAGRNAGIPEHVLDFVAEAYQRLDIPHLSADVAFDGKRPYLMEFQALYFGTSTQAELCDEYFTKRDSRWAIQPKTMNQEEALAWGVKYYLAHRPAMFIP
jgi:hypothetical protein